MIFPSDPGVRPRLSIGVLAGSIMLSVLGGGGSIVGAADWEVQPRLTVSIGGESDQTIDPTADVPLEVAGGGFVDLAPGLSASTWLGVRTRLRVDGVGFYERYANDAGRTLLSASLRGELASGVSGPWRLRLELGGGAFDDSERPTVRRRNGGAELGIGLVRPRWLLELSAGVQGRRYPDLLGPDEAGILDSYDEGSLEIGLAGRWRAASGVVLGAEASRRGTDARDPAFDSEAWILGASLSLRVRTGTWFVVSALDQRRTFTSRTPGLDEDVYRRAGCGIEHALGPELTLSARLALALYERTDGEEIDSARASVAFTWRPGRRTIAATVAAVAAPETLPRAGRPLLFRHHAPGASAVSLVGDFNGWGAVAMPLRKANDGWWETSVALPAGLHQYAFLVDGRTVAPADAERYADDGFGGRNGLIEILEEDE